jgi:hypothetical protein
VLGLQANTMKTGHNFISLLEKVCKTKIVIHDLDRSVKLNEVTNTKNYNSEKGQLISHSTE